MDNLPVYNINTNILGSHYSFAISIQIFEVHIIVCNINTINIQGNILGLYYKIGLQYIKTNPNTSITNSIFEWLGTERDSIKVYYILA